MIKGTRTGLRFFSNQWKVPEHRIVIDKNSYRMAHAVWSLEDAENVQVTHRKPEGIRDWTAYSIMKGLRVTFDFLSKYNPGHMTENLYLRRFVFLETVAGVPGMIGGMIRHLKSLGMLREDGGWIHHLLEEAENERMHLFTFLALRQPGILFRIAILGTQSVFLLGFSLSYMLSSKTCHRFVGYLEEEAVKTYTNCLKELDEDKLPQWKNMPAPKNAIAYWGLPENSNWRDVLLAVRADEVMHREVNHHLANINQDQPIEGHAYHISENIVGEARRFENKVAEQMKNH